MSTKPPARFTFLLDPDLKVPAFADFKLIVDGISALGFRWVPASTMP